MVPLLALFAHKVAAKLHRVVHSQRFVAADTVQNRMVLMCKWEVAAVPDTAASSTACFASLFASAGIALAADSCSAAVVVVLSQIVMQMLAKSLTAQFAVL